MGEESMTALLIPRCARVGRVTVRSEEKIWMWFYKKVDPLSYTTVRMYNLQDD